jgi:hypothetical protein
VIIAATLVLIPLLVWVVRSAKNRAGSFLVAYSLFFSFGQMFEGGPDRIEQANDPEQKKRAANSDLPEK